MIKDKILTEGENIFSSEIIAKFDSIKFDISEFKYKGLYDEEHIKMIDHDLDKVTLLMHSNHFNNIEAITKKNIPRLAQNIQGHQIVVFLEPYEQIFNDHIIKLRSFPTSVLDMNDSGTILGFFQQFQSTLIFLKSKQRLLYSFDTIYSLSFSVTKICGIITKLMRNPNIDDFYYKLLNQMSESLINLQNCLNLVRKIENDSHSLLDINTVLIRKMNNIEQKLATKVAEKIGE